MPVLIKRGHRGQYVRDIQTRLNLDARVGYSVHPRLAEDGIYGPKTATRVAEWQTMRGLKSDGIVGPNTWNAMFGGPIPGKVAADASKPAGKQSRTRGVLYVHAHDVPGKGTVGSNHDPAICHHIIVPAGQARDAPEMMKDKIESENLILGDMVLNTHGGGAGRISIGGAMVNLRTQPRFFKAVKGQFASGAVLRIVACAFAVRSVPLNDPEAWLVTPDELAYGEGIKALQEVARYLNIPAHAGFGMQFGDMSGFTGIWVSCQPNGQYSYHLRGRRMSAGEFLGMIDEMVSAAPHQWWAQVQKLKHWLVG